MGSKPEEEDEKNLKKIKKHRRREMGLRRKERKMEQSKVCGCTSVTSYVETPWRLQTE